MGALVLTGMLLGACGSQESTVQSRPAAPDDVLVPVAFGLPRDTDGLAEAVRAVSDPQSSQYRQWLDADQIGDQFGASEQVAARVLEEMQEQGFDGEIDPTRGYLTGEMTVGDAERLLGIAIVQFPIDNGTQTLIGPDTATDKIKPPKDVQEVVGLTGSISESGQTGRQNTVTRPSSVDLSSCVPLPQLEYLTSGQFGLTEDYPGAGSGVHVAMLEVDQVDPGVLDYLADCYGFPKPEYDVQAVGPINQSDIDRIGEVESDLDLALLVVGAPQLRKITVYQSNSVTSVFFPTAAAVRASFAPEGPTIVTTSVGFCEPDVPRNDIALSEWSLMTGAASGLTVTAASGDSGSSSCAPGNTSEQPQYPSSSPYVTGVGGTQFAQSADLQAAQSDPLTVRNPGSQVVWNSDSRSAGGGSTTSTIARPWYQDSVHKGKQRSVPDVSYLASPFSLSPLLLCNSSGNCQQYGVGGTSAAAPGFAAAIARIASDTPESASKADRFGLLNPTIYGLADRESGSVVDITEGNNDIYSVGCCEARVGFDSASGWGALDVVELDRSLE